MKRHHPTLHGAKPLFVGTSSVIPNDVQVLLQIVPVAVIFADGRVENTLAMLDAGSQTSFSKALQRD